MQPANSTLTNDATRLSTTFAKCDSSASCNTTRIILLGRPNAYVNKTRQMEALMRDNYPEWDFNPQSLAYMANAPTS